MANSLKEYRTTYEVFDFRLSDPRKPVENAGWELRTVVKFCLGLFVVIGILLAAY